MDYSINRYLSFEERVAQLNEWAAGLLGVHSPIFNPSSEEELSAFEKKAEIIDSAVLTYCLG